MSITCIAAQQELPPAPPPAPHRNHPSASLPFAQPRPGPPTRSLLHALCDLRPDALSRFVSALLLPRSHPDPSQHPPSQSHVNDSSSCSSTATDVYGTRAPQPHPLAALRLTCRAARDRLVDPSLSTPSRLVWDQADYQQQQQHVPARRPIHNASVSSWTTAARPPAEAYAATKASRDGAGSGLGQQPLRSVPNTHCSSLIKDKTITSTGRNDCRSWREAVLGLLRTVATRWPGRRELTLHALVDPCRDPTTLLCAPFTEAARTLHLALPQITSLTLNFETSPRLTSLRTDQALTAGWARVNAELASALGTCQGPFDAGGSFCMGCHVCAVQHEDPPRAVQYAACSYYDGLRSLRPDPGFGASLAALFPSLESLELDGSAWLPPHGRAPHVYDIAGDGTAGGLLAELDVRHLLYLQRLAGPEWLLLHPAIGQLRGLTEVEVRVEAGQPFQVPTAVLQLPQLCGLTLRGVWVQHPEEQLRGLRYGFGGLREVGLAELVERLGALGEEQGRNGGEGGEGVRERSVVRLRVVVEDEAGVGGDEAAEGGCKPLVQDGSHGWVVVGPQQGRRVR